MERCLYCYKELKEGQVDYHPACARKLFGTRQAPQLPYVRSEIGELAKQVVRAQTTLCLLYTSEITSSSSANFSAASQR